MQKHLSSLFRTRYLEHVKGDTFTASMSCSTCAREPVRMKRHVFTETRPEPSNIGFTDFSVTALPDCGKGIALVAAADFLLPTKKGCEAKYSILRRASAAIKT